MVARVKREQSLDLPNPKIRKLMDSEDKFRPGSIISVKVKNFTTYHHGQFKLSPTLNMIIGPNGAGKSTLVAAICMGLGGRFDLIKRKSLESMITTGCTESTIEITLKNFAGSPPINIRRVFDKKSSSWFVDDEASEEKAIKRICKTFNIQLDNLCHFLPQERVAEFASLSPEKLLFETERTIESGRLLHLHEDLIKNDSAREDLRNQLATSEERLEALIQEKEGHETEVQRFEEYQEKVKEVKLHQMLIPYAHLQDLKEKQKSLKSKRDSCKTKLSEFDDKVNPLRKAITELEVTLNIKESELSTSISKLTTINSQHETTKEKIGKNLESILGFKLTRDNLSNKSKTRKQELESMKLELDDFRKRLDGTVIISDEELQEGKSERDLLYEQMNDIKIKVDNIADAVSDLSTKINKIKREKEDAEKRLTSNDKIGILEPRGNYRNELMENAYGAHRFLRLKKEFKGLYLEAPVVSCDVTDSTFAKYIEKVIDNNTLLSIVIPSQESYKQIQKELFVKFNAPIRVTQQVAQKSQISKEVLKDLGFEGYLSEFISGPKEVLNMLNVVSKLNLIPVSRKPLTDAQLKRVLHADKNTGRLPFMRFIAGDNLFTIARSKYGSKQFFYTTEQVVEARFFGHIGLSPDVKLEIQRGLKLLNSEQSGLLKLLEVRKEELKKHTAELHNHDIKFGKIKERVDDMQSKKKHRTQLLTFIRQREERIKKLDRDRSIEYSEKVKVLEKKIADKYASYASELTDLSEIIQQKVQMNISVEKTRLELLEVKNLILVHQKRMQDLNQYRLALEREYQAAKEKYAEIKKSDAAKQIREQNKSYTQEERSTLSKLAEEYLKEGMLTEEIIRNKISLLEDEKSMMSTADRSSIEGLRKTTSKIESLEIELPKLRAEEERLNQRISILKEQWEPELSKYIGQISNSFQQKFVAVASDGQVELRKSPRFKDWKLEILVKFRENSDLKALDNKSQSGGERAVSTIFFIMALQGITDAPFRVVDEINQGMDPKNEKMAHRYLVNTACQNNSSQYFLVTPKLLNGLYYHPDMVIHCIFTGPYVPQKHESDRIENGSKEGILDFRNL